MTSAQGIGAPLAESVQEPLLTQLLRLFPSRGNSLMRRVGSPSWRRMSQFHYLSDEEIAASIGKDALYVRATTFDDKSAFLVITIPAISRYKDQEQFARLLSCLRTLQLNPKAYLAADSEDIQVFLPFTEATNTATVLRVLVRELANNSFEITDDTLVVHSPEQPFALPLQAKFAWLNDDLSVKVLRDDIALDAAMALFLADMSRAAVSPAVLLERPLSPAAGLNVVPENPLRETDVDEAPVESLPVLEPLLTAKQQAPADELPEEETLSVHGTQLQLFSMPPVQQTKQVPVSVRRSRQQRPRSDPRSPRAEPPSNKLFSVITTDSISSSVQGKEVNQKD